MSDCISYFRYGQDIVYVQKEFAVMEADIMMQMSLAEAMKSRQTGQNISASNKFMNRTCPDVGYK